MKKFSRSILTIGLTTSIILESFLLTPPHKVSANTYTTNTQPVTSTPLELYKASDVSDSSIQLATSAKKSSTNFNNSLQNTINQTEA